MRRRLLAIAFLASAFLASSVHAAIITAVPALSHVSGATALSTSPITTFVRNRTAGNDNVSSTSTTTNSFNYVLNDFQSSYVDMVFTVNTTGDISTTKATEYRVNGLERLTVLNMEWTSVKFSLGFMVNGVFTRAATVFPSMAGTGIGLDFDWPNKDPVPIVGLLPAGQSAVIDNTTAPDVLTYSGFDVVGLIIPGTTTWNGIQNNFSIDVPSASQFSSGWATQLISSNSYQFVMRMEPGGPNIAQAQSIPEPTTAAMSLMLALAILPGRRGRR